MQTKFDTLFAYLKKNNIVAPFAKITLCTKPKLLASAKPVYPEGIEKISTFCAQLGSNYENVVKNLTQDFDFKAEALWNGAGRHLKENRYLVEHVDKPGQLYLAYRPIPNTAKIERWFDAATQKQIEAPIDFLPKKSPSKTGVAWRVVMLENVQEIQAGATFDFTT